jgi:hypothetical protein
MPFLHGPVHDGLDARVQSGNIASTCQDSNLHLRRSFLRMSNRHPCRSPGAFILQDIGPDVESGRTGQENFFS